MTEIQLPNVSGLFDPAHSNKPLEDIVETVAQPLSENTFFKVFSSLTAMTPKTHGDTTRQLSETSEPSDSNDKESADSTPESEDTLTPRYGRDAQKEPAPNLKIEPKQEAINLSIPTQPDDLASIPVAAPIPDGAATAAPNPAEPVSFNSKELQVPLIAANLKTDAQQTIQSGREEPLMKAEIQSDMPSLEVGSTRSNPLRAENNLSVASADTKAALPAIELSKSTVEIGVNPAPASNKTVHAPPEHPQTQGRELVSGNIASSTKQTPPQLSTPPQVQGDPTQKPQSGEPVQRPATQQSIPSTHSQTTPTDQPQTTQIPRSSTQEASAPSAIAQREGAPLLAPTAFKAEKPKEFLSGDLRQVHPDSLPVKAERLPVREVSNSRIPTHAPPQSTEQAPVPFKTPTPTLNTSADFDANLNQAEMQKPTPTLSAKPIAQPAAIPPDALSNTHENWRAWDQLKQPARDGNPALVTHHSASERRADTCATQVQTQPLNLHAYAPAQTLQAPIPSLTTSPSVTKTTGKTEAGATSELLNGDAAPLLQPRDSSTTALPPVQGSKQSELARQVAVQLATAATTDGRSVDLRLNPEELGRVRLLMSPSEGGISVAIMAERGETLDLMRRHINLLENEFREMGYDDVKFSFGPSSQDTAQHQNSGQKSDGGSRELSTSEVGEAHHSEHTHPLEKPSNDRLDLRF